MVVARNEIMERRSYLTVVACAAAATVAGCSEPSADDSDEDDPQPDDDEPNGNETDGGETEDVEFTAEYEEGHLTATWDYDGIDWIVIHVYVDDEEDGRVKLPIEDGQMEWSGSVEPDTDGDTRLELFILDSDETIREDGELVGVVAETSV